MKSESSFAFLGIHKEFILVLCCITSPINQLDITISDVGPVCSNGLRDTAIHIHKPVMEKVFKL